MGIKFNCGAMKERFFFVHNLDCVLRYLAATQVILIQCGAGNDEGRPMEAHKRSPDAAWGGRMHQEDFQRKWCLKEKQWE